MEVTRNKKFTESKKFLAAALALACVMVVYILGVILIVQCPTVAGEINSMSNLVITFIVSLFSMLILGQSAVDYKMQSTMQSEIENKVSYEELKETKTININHNIEVDKTIIGNQKEDDYMIDELIGDVNYESIK